MINVIVKTFEGMVKISFGNDERLATLTAKSYGIENNVPVAILEQI